MQTMRVCVCVRACVLVFRPWDSVQAWERTNKVFGLSDRNGPLEAAW